MKRVTTVLILVLLFSSLKFSPVNYSNIAEYEEPEPKKSNVVTQTNV